MNRIVFNDPRVGQYIAERAKCVFNEAVDNTIGVVDDSVDPESPAYVRGGVLFTNYTQTAIWLHMAGCGGRWASPTFLWVVFDYGFNQLGCTRLYGVVEQANTHALGLDMELGFEIEAILPDMFASGAAVVVSMTREQCRWLNIKPRTLMEGRYGRWKGWGCGGP